MNHHKDIAAILREATTLILSLPDAALIKAGLRYPMIDEMHGFAHMLEDEVALTHVAKPVPVEAGDGLLTPEQRRSLIDACNIPKEPLRVSGELPGGFKPIRHLSDADEELETAWRCFGD